MVIVSSDVASSARVLRILRTLAEATTDATTAICVDDDEFGRVPEFARTSNAEFARRIASFSLPIFEFKRPKSALAKESARIAREILRQAPRPFNPRIVGQDIRRMLPRRI